MVTPERPDPDALLARVVEEEERSRRGRLKLFFGAAPGVGKTYTMLEAARAAAARGPVAVRTAKRVLQEGQDGDVRVAHALEQAAFGSVFGSRDKGEGIAAFLEKRDPEFRGE